jgi:hypothetical protein
MQRKITHLGFNPFKFDRSVPNGLVSFEHDPDTKGEERDYNIDGSHPAIFYLILVIVGEYSENDTQERGYQTTHRAGARLKLLPINLSLEPFSNPTVWLRPLERLQRASAPILISLARKGIGI